MDHDPWPVNVSTLLAVNWDRMRLLGGLPVTYDPSTRRRSSTPEDKSHTRVGAQQLQARGPEEWLKLRNRQAEQSAARDSGRSEDQEQKDATKGSAKGTDDDLGL